MRRLPLLVGAVLLATVFDLLAQKKALVAPTLYGNVFRACATNAPCTRIAEFSVESIPNGCCVLEVMNGGGSNKRAVNSYEIYLNGVRIIKTQSSDFATAAVKPSNRNTVKVVLQGKPPAAIMLMLVFDPRQKQ